MKLPRRLTQTNLEWSLLLAFLLLLVLHTLPHAWRTLNTDFPNYYLTALLSREHSDVSQAYDWRWLQREKDHRNIDQRIIGLAPITPFSTLFVWPLTHLPPLPAKRIWVLLQLALLPPIALLLRSLTGQPLRRIALLILACLPLHRNLLYGQFYILLLALLVAACWALQRRLPYLAGALLGIATMAKIFPAVFLLYLARKQDWRALGAALLTVAATLAVSIRIFGWSIHRHYLQVVLPATLRGETLPPYLLGSQSLSSLLHHLFLYEPQWNPHPWHNLPLLAAALGPVIQTLLLAPALLLIPATYSPKQIPLEWSTLLCITLTISTIPASYNFTLLILPIVVLCTTLYPNYPRLAAAAILLYLAAGYPGWNTTPAPGLHAIAHVPRLWFLLALCVLCLWRLAQTSGPTPINLLWAGAILLVTIGGVRSAIHHQRGLFDDYIYRLPMPDDVLLAASPQYSSSGVRQIELLSTGYRLTGTTRTAPPDQLSFAISPSGNWIEESGLTSIILPPTGIPIPDARAPIALTSGNDIAYLRDQRGRGQLFQRSIPLTPAWLNVLEATSTGASAFLVAATSNTAPAQLYRILPGIPPTPMNLGEARYPALSPDRRSLAYSRFQSGYWNLWILDLATNLARPLGTVPCNQVEASWEPDSNTLLYSSDCGRALGFTATCRRRVHP